jgi:predicted ester cyclase
MSPEANKALVQRYLEMYQTGDATIADDIIAADFVDHGHPTLPPGPQGVKQMVARMHSGLSDAVTASEPLLAEGDTVAFRYAISGTHSGHLGSLPPTNRRVTITGADFFRVANGKLVELWSYQDTLGMLLQLGYILTSPAARMA